MSGEAPASQMLADSTIEAIDHMFALLRQVALAGPDSLEVRHAAGALAQAFEQARPPFTLQLLQEGVLRDRVPLPLSLEAFRRAQQLVAVFHRLNIHELAVDVAPAPHALCALGEVLFDAAHKGRYARGIACPGLHLRALPRAKSGSAHGDALVDQLVCEQLALACQQAEPLTATRAVWPWQAGRALAFRLERCMTASVSVTSRTLELLPGPWPHAQRVVAAAFHVGAVLARLQVSPLSQRAAMHAALVLAVHGLRERGGVPLAVAARSAWPTLIAAGDDRDDAEQEGDPHRLRVCALVQAAACDAPSSARLLVPLLHIAYELERRRCPAGNALRLSRLDLQAWLANALGSEVHAGFGRALLGLFGIVPVGSHVVADGRLGVVISAGERGDPLRPRVLVGGQIMLPAQPVELYSPVGMTPWAK